MKPALKILLSFPVLFSFLSAVAQITSDTVKPGKINDPMVVKPGKVNDDMTVKSAVPNDEMAIMTDTGFINRNIRDNTLEIELAELGRTKGTSPMVKKAATLLKADHSAMLNDLKKVAVSRGVLSKTGINKVPALPPLQIPEGSSFDSTWASAMLTMHHAKIAEFEKFQPVTRDADLKAIISKALPKPETHTEMLSKIPGAKITPDPNAVIH